MGRQAAPGADVYPVVYQVSFIRSGGQGREHDDGPPDEAGDCYDLPAVPIVKSDPIRLVGPWAEGYVLERQHTLSSDFLGYDSYGHAQFDTKRSELGELVFR